MFLKLEKKEMEMLIFANNSTFHNRQKDDSLKTE